MGRRAIVRAKGSYRVNILVLLIVLVCAGCTCFSIPLVGSERSLDEPVVAGKGKDKIVLLDISGVLSSKEKRGLLAFQQEASIVARVREELQKAALDKQGCKCCRTSDFGMLHSQEICHHNAYTGRPDSC